MPAPIITAILMPIITLAGMIDPALADRMMEGWRAALDAAFGTGIPDRLLDTFVPIANAILAFFGG